MHMLGTPIDYVIVAAYFVGILLFGSYFSKFSKTTKDFFFGGQRFSWWLIAASLVATGIGSYSFIKYAQAGFERGMSSTLTYLNDWFIIPFFMFGWMPIIYFARIKSIPEYFQRRFDERTRVIATVLILLYLLGYIGFNFYLLGIAMESLLGIPIVYSVVTVAIISAIYVTLGGQTAVIFTDLIQGAFLYLAGGLLLYLGLRYVGGIHGWWQGLDLAHRMPFPGFNRPSDFNLFGIFWAEGVVGTLAFTFMNQGFIMRYLAIKSVNEGRKCLTWNTLILMPISAVVVGNVGWMAASAIAKGIFPASAAADILANPKHTFVVATNIICRPGVFGFVIAALTAALMSTIDTLINACTAIGVFDIYKAYIKKDAADKHYLKVARIFSVGATILGLALVWPFSTSRSLFAAHYAFVGIITPPVVVAIFLGILWKRFNAKAAFWSILIGAVVVFSSLLVPDMIKPLALTHGMDTGHDLTVTWYTVDNDSTPTMIRKASVKKPIGEPTNEFILRYGTEPDNYTNEVPAYVYVEQLAGRTFYRYSAYMPNLKPRTKYAVEVVGKEGKAPSAAGFVKTGGNFGYFRALFGLLVTLIVAVILTLFTKRDEKKDLAGLTIWTIQEGRARFKGGKPNDIVGKKVKLPLKVTAEGDDLLHLSKDAMERLKAEVGDLMYIADSRWYLGGLRSLHIHLGEPHKEGDVAIISKRMLDEGNLISDKMIKVEKII